MEFDEALQEAFAKVRTGEIFDELEVEGFLYEKDLWCCKRAELVIKQEVRIEIPVRCIKSEVFKI